MNNSFRYIFSFFIFISCSAQLIFSQEINYTAEFKGVLDNREYFTKYSPHYTIFGSLFSTGINLKSGTNNFDFGLNYFYEFGDLEKTKKPDFYANYHYCGEGNDFYFGVFQRENLINFHRALLNDTLLYSRPYVEGIYYSKKYKNITEQIWIDWTSLQTDTIRETFLVGQKGIIDLQTFYIQHQFLMLHYSLPKVKHGDEKIRDNFGFLVQVGHKKSSFFLLDSAAFSFGALIGMDRLRGIYNWKTPVGGLAETHLRYKRLILNILLYIGESQDIFYGDKFYGAKTYSRWDLSLNIFNTKNIKGEIELACHFVDKTIDFAQAFRIWVDLDYPIFRTKNTN